MNPDTLAATDAELVTGCIEGNRDAFRCLVERYQSLVASLIGWGGFSAGLFAFGGFSVGWWAVCGMAFGWKAFAGCAVAWRGAMGGVAVADDFARGGVAYAARANNKAAVHWLWALKFFRDTDYAGEHLQWLNLPWVLPLLQWWRVLKKRKLAQPGEVI
jgi:hypothetical protein